MARIIEINEDEDQRGHPPGIVRESNSRIIGVWIVVLALSFVAFGVAVYEREFLFEAWPDSTAIYEDLGIKSDATEDTSKPSRMVNFTDRAETEIYNGSIRLKISGRLTNNGTVAVDIPNLRGILRNAAKEEIHSWTFTVEPPMLAPGEERSFSTVVEGIPSETAEYELFVDWPEPTPAIADSSN